MFSSYLSRFSRQEIEKLVEDCRDCTEVDRCFTQCMDVSCDYHSFLRLLRTPIEDLRGAVEKWLDQVTDTSLADMLDKPTQCPEQSYCINFCASDCALGWLLRAMGAHR